MKTILLSLFLFVAVLAHGSGQTCFEIHGRAVQYRGDAFFEIWHVGTHHVFFPADQNSEDLICRYFDCESVIDSQLFSQISRSVQPSDTRKEQRNLP
jgi:hypothetical protein